MLGHFVFPDAVMLMDGVVLVGPKMIIKHTPDYQTVKLLVT